jgi:hypothetical protein
MPVAYLHGNLSIVQMLLTEIYVDIDLIISLHSIGLSGGFQNKLAELNIDHCWNKLSNPKL